MISKMLSVLAIGTALSTALIGQAQAMSLRDATQVALESNPEIGQAMQNREATEFELRQALGLYSPRLDFEASVGAQMLSSPSRRAAGIADDPLLPAQLGLVATFELFDGGFRDAEVARQSARIDGASFRVLERSEFIALQIARVYFQVLLQQRIVALNQQNVTFHNDMLAKVGESIDSGQSNEADRMQAMERVAAARAQLTEAGVELEAARIEFAKYVGLPPGNISMPARVGASLPSSLDVAIGEARMHNAMVLMAHADLDAASALVDQAESAFGPKMQLEARASTGYDVGGTDELTHDLSARLSMRWNIFDGGIRNAEVQEQIRRESEAVLAQDQTYREVEEAVRTSWLRLKTQAELVNAYGEQLEASTNLVSAYSDQFSIGDRSLLDVLDAQNTSINVQILHETVRFGVYFAEYRMKAATGTLLNFMQLKAPQQADAYARSAFGAPSFDASEPRARMPANLATGSTY